VTHTLSAHSPLAYRPSLTPSSARHSISRASTPPLSIHSCAGSPASPAGTLVSRRSYTVVVHERTVHTPARLSPSPSFKRKSPEQQHPDDAAERKRRRQSAISLRRDPDVATLLGMYDADGALDVGAFESPEGKKAEPVGRAQRQRMGSTLRELLGEKAEGDISWAERLLG
jgi:hypothetical protein